MKVAIVLKSGKVKMAKAKEAKILVKAGYAKYQEEPQTYMTRQLVAEEPKKRGRPKKVKEEIVEEVVEDSVDDEQALETEEETEEQKD